MSTPEKRSEKVDESACISPNNKTQRSFLSREQEMSQPSLMKSSKINESRIKSQSMDFQENSIHDYSCFKLKEQNQKLEEYQENITCEEKMLKDMQDKADNQLKVFLNKKTQADNVCMDYEKLNSSMCALEREKERTLLKIKKLREKMEQLKEARENKKCQRQMRAKELKGISSDIKYKHLLTQLEKQRCENDIENSYCFLKATNKKAHDSIYKTSVKNDRIINKEYKAHLKDNKKKYLNGKIEKELIKMKQMEYEREKTKKIHDRIKQDMRNEEKKILDYRNKIMKCVHHKGNLNDKYVSMKKEEKNVSNSLHRKRLKKVKSVFDVEKELKKRIAPEDYKDPESMAHKPSQDVALDGKVGTWAQAINDPKQAFEANRKLWDRFGYGIDWNQIENLRGNQGNKKIQPATTKASSKTTRSMNANDLERSKVHMKKLSRNFGSDAGFETLPLLSQKQVKDIKNQKKSIMGIHFLGGSKKDIQKENMYTTEVCDKQTEMQSEEQK